MIETSEDTRLIQQITAQYSAPAYVRRARRVEDAWERLIASCGIRRDEFLKMPKLRLGVLHALAGDWSNLSTCLTDHGSLSCLIELFECWQPRLRVRVERTVSSRKLRMAIGQLGTSFERFNRQWNEFVHKLDLREINTLRDEYNRFYVLEKECSVRSAAIAREGFRPLAPATIDDIFRVFPLLRVPE